MGFIFYYYLTLYTTFKQEKLYLKCFEIKLNQIIDISYSQKYDLNRFSYE